jgi:mannose/fructose-specific phosphotransferase system component IIA
VSLESLAMDAASVAGAGDDVASVSGLSLHSLLRRRQERTQAEIAAARAAAAGAAGVRNDSDDDEDEDDVGAAKVGRAHEAKAR